MYIQFYKPMETRVRQAEEQLELATSDRAFIKVRDHYF